MRSIYSDSPFLSIRAPHNHRSPKNVDMVYQHPKSFADHIGYAGPDRTPYRLGRPDAGRQSDWNSRITDENPQVIWEGVAVLSGPQDQRIFSPGSVDPCKIKRGQRKALAKRSVSCSIAEPRIPRGQRSEA